MDRNIYAGEQLLTLCTQKAKELYGDILPSRIEAAIKAELKQMELVEGDMAQKFLDAAELLSAPCFSGSNKYLRGYRGALGASFVAYLCGITPFNPLELPRELKLYPHMFFREGTSCSFYLNVGEKARDIYYEEFVKQDLSDDVFLYTTSNLNLLEALQNRTQDIYICGGYEEKVHTVSVNFYEFFRKSHIEYLPEFHNNQLARQIIPCAYRNRPNAFRSARVSVGDLAKIIGLLHGSGTWIDNAEYLAYENKWLDRVVSCAEDVYEYLLEHDMSHKNAFDIMDRVRCGNKFLTEDDFGLMEKYHCEEWFIKSVGQIQHLFYRAQTLCYALEAKRLIYYFKKYPTEYVEIFREQFYQTRTPSICKNLASP